MKIGKRLTIFHIRIPVGNKVIGRGQILDMLRKIGNRECVSVRKGIESRVFPTCWLITRNDGVHINSFRIS